MDPPATFGQAPASDQTTGEFVVATTGSFDDLTTGQFVNQTCSKFGNQTTGKFTDQTSITPLILPRAKIVLWGDSLTQTSFDGWSSLLANRYQRRADIINRGMSGYNTSWYLLLPDESHSNVALCTIWFGANDASLPQHNPHHFVSLADYQQNLRTLVQKAKKLLGNPPLLLITPPPVHHEQRFAYQKQRYGDKATGVLERTLENSGKYAQGCVDVATELKLPCLNLWEEFQSDDKDWSKYLSDGLHFSQEGHQFVFDCLLRAIEQYYPQLVVTPCGHTGQACNSGSTCAGLPTFGPYHDEIDSKQPDVIMKSSFQNLAISANANDTTTTNSTTTTTTSEEEIANKKPKMDAP